MAEIVSAFPTAGGIYYWASKLGGPVWGWFTGWFNLIGLIGVVASVDYACAQFLSITISLFDPSWDALNLKRVFIIYLCLLTCHTILNVFPSHILAYWNNTSAVWHIVGPAIIVADPDLRPGSSPERLVGVHGARERIGLLRRRDGWCRLVVLRAPVRGAAADAVHDHRLRCVRAPLGGDPRGIDQSGEGRLEGDLLLGDRRLDSPALLPVRRDERRRDQQESRSATS